MPVSRSILILVASAAFALAPVVGCSGTEAAYDPGGTLPPIRTTTTLGPTDTTLLPFYEVYKLKAGENLGTVANRYNVPINELIAANKDVLGANPSNVPVGTELLIPPHRYIETLPPTTTTIPG